MLERKRSPNKTEISHLRAAVEGLERRVSEVRSRSPAKTFELENVPQLPSHIMKEMLRKPAYDKRLTMGPF
jgi:hypothetical protein